MKVLLVILAAIVVSSSAVSIFLLLGKLETEKVARVAAEKRLEAATAARIDALNAAAQEKIARVQAENTATLEKLARIAAENEADRQMQARIEAEALATAESAGRTKAEKGRNNAQNEAERQKQARIHAEEAAQAERNRRSREAAARRAAEQLAERERTEKEDLAQAMASQQTRSEKARILELAKTHPAIRAIVSGELAFYFKPLPYYAGSEVSEAVEDIAQSFSSWTPYGATVRRVYSPEDADIAVTWVRDYGAHIVGESIFAAHIKVGLGATNCVGEWMAYDGDTVRRTLWHELGHSMGYGHSDDPDNVMYEFGSTRFEVDQEISEVIAGGWYLATPLCETGSYSYFFETDDLTMGFDIFVLPPGSDPADVSLGDVRSYVGCGQEGLHRYLNSCTVDAGAMVYIGNTSHLDPIRLTGRIIHADSPPWPDMTWDPQAYQYDDATLARYGELFHNK